jgi:hypothetical protein
MEAADSSGRRVEVLRVEGPASRHRVQLPWLVACAAASGHRGEGGYRHRMAESVQLRKALGCTRGARLRHRFGPHGEGFQHDRLHSGARHARLRLRRAHLDPTPTVTTASHGQRIVNYPRTLFDLRGSRHNE